MNSELPDVQASFRNGRGTEDQIAHVRRIMEKAREFQKNFCFIDYAKAFDCVDHHKLWEILQVMGIQDHLTCLLRKLYSDQEATVRTGHGITDWFQEYHSIQFINNYKFLLWPLAGHAFLLFFLSPTLWFLCRF